MLSLSHLLLGIRMKHPSDGHESEPPRTADASATGEGEAAGTDNDSVDPFVGLTTVELADLIYEVLRGIAGARQRRDRVAAGMNPTSLIHRAYLRLVQKPGETWNSRAHFVGAAAEAMRRVCIDEARAQAALKRGGDRCRVPLSDVLERSHAATISESMDLLSLSEALDRMAQVSARAAEIVKMRFFAGLTVDEVATLLNLSSRTVLREWEFARAWLFAELNA